MTELERLQFETIRAGDAEAFGQWLAGAEPVLRRSLRAWAAAVDVEAVLQEGLLRVWQAAPRIEPDGRPELLLRFAHVVVKNLAASEARRWKAAPAEPGEPPVDRETPVEPQPPDPYLRKLIALCREKLPGRPRAALEARLGSSGAQHDSALADAVGMSLNTFLQNFTRARKLLEQCLKKAGVDLSLELAP